MISTRKTHRRGQTPPCAGTSQGSLHTRTLHSLRISSHQKIQTHIKPRPNHIPLLWTSGFPIHRRYPASGQTVRCVLHRWITGRTAVGTIRQVKKWCSQYQFLFFSLQPLGGSLQLFSTSSLDGLHKETCSPGDGLQASELREVRVGLGGRRAAALCSVRKL